MLFPIILTAQSPEAQIPPFIQDLSLQLKAEVVSMSQEFHHRGLRTLTESPYYARNFTPTFSSIGVMPVLSLRLSYLDRYSVTARIATNVPLWMLLPDNFIADVHDSNGVGIEVIDYRDDRNPVPTGKYAKMRFATLETDITLKYFVTDRLSLKANWSYVWLSYMPISTGVVQAYALNLNPHCKTHTASLGANYLVLDKGNLRGNIGLNIAPLVKWTMFDFDEGWVYFADVPPSNDGYAYSFEANLQRRRLSLAYAYANFSGSGGFYRNKKHTLSLGYLLKK